MESPCLLGLVLLCSLAAVGHCEPASLRAQLREWIGLGNSPSAAASKSGLGAVFVLFNNESDEKNVGAAGVIDSGQLIGVAGELEERDPGAVYVQFDGDNLVTSHAYLFGGEDTLSFPGLLQKIKTFRGKHVGSYPDLIALQVNKFRAPHPVFPFKVSPTLKKATMRNIASCIESV